MPAPTNPSFVQVQPNSSGPAVDLADVDQQPTTPTNTVTVREICAIGDPNAWPNVAGVTAVGDLQTFSGVEAGLLGLIFIELQVANKLLNENRSFGMNLDLDSLRTQIRQQLQVSRTIT